MKKVLYILLFLVLNNFAQAQKQDRDQKITVRIINDAEISAAIRSAFNNLSCNPSSVVDNCGISSFTENDFDFNNIYESLKSGETEVCYSVKHKDSNGFTDYSFSVFTNKGTLGNPTLVSTISDRSNIVYDLLDENKSFEVKKINDVYTYKSRDVNFGSTSRMFSCGQCVINCINDAYTSHGWASVWAFVQSIYLPATGAAIAIGCIGRCCPTN